ncbi:hypothetical protein M427DRAFT_32370 [Gonapodya prolifera JEL478]|uniref:Uncharacterized protein n=1 Tax=Gonapodya prolifera (strain JEL478) TaxID=1344416 RepID=A0A139AF10_GONPJ|nr:hypothetical protein M427DRAFT_32370 [Gonapodya prolifera JEL478]|eukprot:KXS15412.1 hypothetical protein M427DRAFT_32370 [Gonapodya prolifera JEL478]
MSAGRANISNALGGLVARGAAAVQSAVAHNPTATSFGALPELPSQTSNASFGRTGGGSWGKAAGARLSGGRRGSALYGPGWELLEPARRLPTCAVCATVRLLPAITITEHLGRRDHGACSNGGEAIPAAALAELEGGGGLSGSPEMLSPADAESRGRSPRGSSVSGSSRRGSRVGRAASEDGSEAGERWLVKGGRPRTGHARSKSEGGVPASPAEARMDFGKRGVGAFGEKLLEEEEEGGEVPPLLREKSGI